MFLKNYRKLSRSIYMIKLGMETQRDQFHFRSESSNKNDKETLIALEKCLDYWIKEINETMGWTDNHLEEDTLLSVWKDDEME